MPAALLALAGDEAILVASGDLRLSANQMCWPAQEAMEKAVIAAFAKEGSRSSVGTHIILKRNMVLLRVSITAWKSFARSRVMPG